MSDGPTMRIAVTAITAARCHHPEPSPLDARRAWCTRCGALRLGSGDPPLWIRPGYLAVVVTELEDEDRCVAAALEALERGAVSELEDDAGDGRSSDK